MKRIYFQIVSLVLSVLALSSTAHGAVLYDSLEINFGPARQADRYQNVLDPNEASNYETWDPVPDGVWFGGWTMETKFRIDDVPDDDYQIALAQVALFGPEIIMSGAARTLVRLPMFTGDDPWDHALLYVYEIGRGTNWTFEQNITERAGGSGHELNDMRISFTSGSHELIYWSQEMDPTDTSKTDDNDHFSRSNRTFCYVDSPIKPSTYYLFITYVWYASDRLVDIYIEPDSLDSTAKWNRSTVATYNEEAPDLYDLGVFDFNLSLGYSFDFVNGFGNSAYGLNQWFEAGDDIEFWTYVDPDHVNTSHYLTFMLPYRSSVPNLTWDVTLYAFDEDFDAKEVLFSIGPYRCTDFILFSMQDALSNNISTIAWGGWIKVYLSVNNATRLWLPFWDVPMNASRTWNEDWFLDQPGIDWKELDYIHAPDGDFDLMQYFEIERGPDPLYHYFWTVQHSVQFNDYYWAKTTGSTPGTEVSDETGIMKFVQRIFWGMTTIFLRVAGGEITPVIAFAIDVARAAQIATSIVTKYAMGLLSSLDGTALDWILMMLFPLYALGRLMETLGITAEGVFVGLMEFLDAALGIIIFLLAMVALFVPIYFTVKGAMALRKAILGDLEGASAEIKGAAESAVSAVGTVGKAVTRRR